MNILARKFLLPALALAGAGACDSGVPEPDHNPTCAEVATLPRVDMIPEFQLAAELTWAKWRMIGNPVQVVLVPGRELYKDPTGWRLYGRTCSPDGHNGVVYIALRSEHPSATSLAHEYLHIHLYQTQGDSDENHLKKDWWTAELIDMNGYLEDQGL